MRRLNLPECRLLTQSERRDKIDLVDLDLRLERPVGWIGHSLKIIVIFFCRPCYLRRTLRSDHCGACKEDQFADLTRILYIQAVDRIV